MTTTLVSASRLSLKMCVMVECRYGTDRWYWLRARMTSRTVFSDLFVYLQSSNGWCSEDDRLDEEEAVPTGRFIVMSEEAKSTNCIRPDAVAPVERFFEVILRVATMWLSNSYARGSDTSCSASRLERFAKLSVQTRRTSSKEESSTDITPRTTVSPSRLVLISSLGRDDENELDLIGFLEFDNSSTDAPERLLLFRDPTRPCTSPNSVPARRSISRSS
mmetsp:Transcript_6215/g.14629  ORF Transcript_6215/g.14629 Transcript_6215/m.14629 type:complete len:219 (-) Transcript_6215:1017-1673(-)